MEEDAFKENMNGNKREVHCRKAKKKKKKKRTPKQRPLHSPAVEMDYSQEGVKIRRRELVVSIGPFRDAFFHMETSGSHSVDRSI